MVLFKVRQDWVRHATVPWASFLAAEGEDARCQERLPLQRWRRLWRRKKRAQRTQWEHWAQQSMSRKGLLMVFVAAATAGRVSYTLFPMRSAPAGRQDEMLREAAAAVLLGL
jgi:hypothetical protein